MAENAAQEAIKAEYFDIVKEMVPTEKEARYLKPMTDQERLEEAIKSTQWRTEMCGGVDPFRAKAKDRKEEDKLTQQLRKLILHHMQAEILTLQQMINKFKHSDFFDEEEMDMAAQKIHMKQVVALETLNDRLKLPYQIRLHRNKCSCESWGERQTKDLEMFPRRLRWALPYCFKWWANKRLIQDPWEQIQFKEDMKDSRPEDFKDIMEDADKLLDIDFD